MAIITPAGNLSDRVVDITADQTGGSGGVPQSRRIDTVAPLAGGGDLSADRILSISLTPASTLAVGASRLINATSPLLVNGAPSASLATDVTISENAFDGNNPGYVVPNPSGPTGNAYLSDTGAWSSSTVSGVPSNRTLHMVPPLTIDGLAAGDLSADRTIDAGVFTNALKGFVPASGGNPNFFLSADGTFKSPTFGSGFVTLQGATPGTADIGNAHINGVFIADTAAVIGSNKKSMNGIGNENLYVKQNSSSNLPVVGSYALSSPSAGWDFKVGRGTEAAPTGTQINDTLVNLNVDPFYGPGSNIYDQRQFLTVTQRQSKGDHVPFDVDIIPGKTFASDPNTRIRMGSNALGGVGSMNTSPVSGWEIQNTFGLLPKVITVPSPFYTYTVTELADPSMFYIDGTLGSSTFVFPTAQGRQGRIYGVTKVDSTNICTLTLTGSATTNWGLFLTGESLIFCSDGFNWRPVASHVFTDQSVVTTDQTAIVNSTVEATAVTWVSWGGNQVPAQMYSCSATGKLSTTSNPTIQFRLYNLSGGILADSGLVETPDTVTNTAWRVEFASGQSNNAPPTGKVIEASLKIAAADGVFNQYSMFSTFGNPSGGVVPDHLTVQWGTADAANTLTCTAGNLRLTPRVYAQ